MCLYHLSAGVFSAARNRNSNSNWLNKKEFYVTMILWEGQSDLESEVSSSVYHLPILGYVI